MDVQSFADPWRLAETDQSPHTSFQAAGSWTPAGHNNDHWYVGDFTGDGLTDIMRTAADGTGAYVEVSSGTFFYGPQSWTTDDASATDEPWYVGDFNGDGWDDVMRYSPGVERVLLSGPGQFGHQQFWGAEDHGAERFYVGDFNGDGKSDLMRYMPGVSGAEVLLSDGTSFLKPESWTAAGHGLERWYVGDFNGDGQDDLMRYVPDVSGGEVFLSNGAAFVEAGSWTGAGNGSDGWYVGDFDGDGASDIFRYLPGESGADMFLA